MKTKILTALLASLVVLFFASYVGAQIEIPVEDIAKPIGPEQTCKLNHDVRWLGNKYTACRKGATVGVATYGPCCIANSVLNVVMWLFYGLVIIALIFMFIGAYQILTAGGNPDKVTLGRKYIMWAVVGLVLALLAFIIPRIVLTLIF